MRAVVGEVLDKKRHRLGKVIAKKVGAVFFDASPLKAGRYHGREVFVHVDAIEPKDKVVGRHWVAVGPLVTGPEEDLQGLRVVVVLDPRGKVGQG